MWPWKKKVEPAPSAEELALQKQKWWDEQLAYVRRCADEADPKNISLVRSDERYAILTAELVRRAKRQVLIHVNELSPEIFGTVFMLDAFETFLNNSRPDGTISIITYVPITPDPGSTLERLVALPRVFTTVEDASIRTIAPFFFAVADKASYWFKDSNKDVGVFAFGDTDFGARLDGLFSDLDHSAYRAA